MFPSDPQALFQKNIIMTKQKLFVWISTGGYICLGSYLFGFNGRNGKIDPCAALLQLVVCGAHHDGDERVQAVEPALRISCHAVDCRGCLDREAWHQGGSCAVLQLHVVAQEATVDVLRTAVNVLAFHPGAKTLLFQCDHGKHRSMACAELFRAAFAPRVKIYNAPRRYFS